MALNRISGLGVLALGSFMLYAGCDSGGSTATPGTSGGAAGTTGGAMSSTTGGAAGTTGGSAATHTGGAMNSTTGGAASPTGGAAQGGGTSSAPAASISGNCQTATAATGTLTNSAGYIKDGNYAGYGFIYISPSSDQTLTVACTDSSKGGDSKYFGTSTTALCGAGTVPADPTYNAVGGIGFNLNQAQAGGTGSNKPITGTVSQIVVTWASATAPAGLHIQVVQDATATGTPTNYCFDAGSAGSTSPLTLTADQFTTTCYNGASDPGTAWDGTNAQSFQFIIPSNATAATVFDMCIEGVAITAG